MALPRLVANLGTGWWSPPNDFGDGSDVEMTNGSDLDEENDSDSSWEPSDSDDDDDADMLGTTKTAKRQIGNRKSLGLGNLMGMG